MSPTHGKTATAAEIVPESQGRQHLASDAPHVYPLDIPRGAMRRLSSVSDNPAKKLRSGSPQLHHFLKAGSSGNEASRKSSHIPVASQKPRPGLRRYSSVDLTLLRGPASAQDETPSPDDGRRATHQLQEIREYKRASLWPGPGSPRLDVTTAERTGLESLSQRTSTAREGPARSPVAGEQYVNSDGFLLRVNGTAAQTTQPETFGATDKEATTRSGDRNTIDPMAWRRNSVTNDGKSLSPMARSTSSGSSMTSSPQSAASSQKTADTEVSFFGPDIDGDETPIAAASVPWSGIWPAPTEKRRSQGPVSDPDRYGTPEMPRGSAKLPHIPTSDLTPRVPSQAHPKHLPRAEKLPKSGYELLASSISATAPSASSTAGNRMSAFLGAPSATRKRGSRRHSSASFFIAPPAAASEEEEVVTVKPIYRKFEALNHRLLLHLQDELSELEEQLHRLDTTDTQTRRLQSSILPASRRTEFLAGGELQWHKTDVLSKIGFKLGQYNHVLASFTATRDLPAPSLSDIAEYRAYLATHQPISEVETRFLDPTDDLISLAASPDDDDRSAPSSPGRAGGPRHARDFLHSLRINDEPIVTPIPGTMHGNSWLVRHNRLSHSHGSGSSRGSATSAGGSPRFARHPPVPGLGEPPMPSPRLPASPLRAAHSVVSPAAPAPGGDGPDDEEEVAAPASSRARAVPVAGTSAHAMVHVAIAMAVAVLVPVLAFSVIPGFVGRMAVVLLVGLSVAGPVAQSGEVKKGTGHGESRGMDLMYSAAVYAVLMAVVARIMV